VFVVKIQNGVVFSVGTTGYALCQVIYMRIQTAVTLQIKTPCSWINKVFYPKVLTYDFKLEIKWSSVSYYDENMKLDVVVTTAASTLLFLLNPHSITVLWLYLK